jgi:hypothetical protein
MSNETMVGSMVGSDGKLRDTYRPQDSFPWGRESDLDIDDFPTDEDEFYWTHHYANESRARSNPAVTESVVEELLDSGVVHKPYNEELDDRFLIQKEIDGAEWTIVIGDDRNGNLTKRATEDGVESVDEDFALITIYSNYHGTVGMTNHYFDRREERSK